MKVFVTGADGLLGSHLVRELLDRGFSVRALVQPGSISPTLRGLKIDRASGDILAEDGSLAEALRGHRFVIHCAAVTDLWADPKLVWDVNLEGTRRILDGCMQEGVERLIYVGSASSFQFGSLENPGDERGSFPAVYRGTDYMESKHRAMELVLEYAKKRELDAVILAPTFMLGAYDSRPSSGELIRSFIKRGLKYIPPGGRNFVYARDVARAVVSALENGRAGGSYILGGQNLSYLDFFTSVATTAGADSPKGMLPKTLVLAAGAAGSAYRKISGRTAVIDFKMAKFACLNTYYSSKKAVEELGMAQTPIEAAIEESIQSLKKYGHMR